eukprot:s6714_g2.t1
MLDERKLAKLSLPGCMRGSSWLVFRILGLELDRDATSERLQGCNGDAGDHYIISCKTYGYRCLNCESCGPDFGAIQALKCHRSEAEAALEADALAQLRELKDLEAQGRYLQDLLEQEQRELEAMMLQAEIDELERQVAQEEEDLRQAKILSLEEAARVEAFKAEASRRPRVEEPHQAKKPRVEPVASEKVLPAASDAKRPRVEGPEEAQQTPEKALLKRPRTSPDAESPAKTALLGPDCFETLPYDMQDVNPGLEYEVFAGEPKHLGAEAAGSDHAPLLRLGQVCQAELTDHDSGDESPGHDCDGSPISAEDITPTEPESATDGKSVFVHNPTEEDPVLPPCPTEENPVVPPCPAKEDPVLPPCPAEGDIKPLSPAVQSEMCGAKRKPKAKASAPKPDDAEKDHDTEGDDDAVVLKRPAARGGRGRGRGRGRAKIDADDGKSADDDEMPQQKEQDEDEDQDEPAPKKGGSKIKAVAPKTKAKAASESKGAKAPKSKAKPASESTGAEAPKAKAKPEVSQKLSAERLQRRCRHLGKDGKMKFTGRKSELKQSGHLASHSWVFGRMGGRRDPERERDAGLERESD